VFSLMKGPEIVTATMFGGTLLLSAFLLFVLEPLIGKMVLPLLGGSPAVWNTCMLFFQCLVLGGYAYTHWGFRWLGARRHAGLHLVLLLCSVASLPVTIRYLSPPSGGSRPVPWLLGTLALSVAIPFVLLASTGPLLQRWFVETRLKRSADPYFLYAASNAGSLGGLLAYPVLVEPNITLGQQSRLWSAGYVLLIVCSFACVISVRWPAAPTRFASRLEALRPSRLERLRWVWLAFVPSSLLLGITTYITTDIAAVPLLWVLPLAIYLLTFIISFSGRRLPQGLVVRWQPVLVIPMVIFLFWGSYLTVPTLLPFHFLVFFFIALMSHGELAAHRPQAERLTEFYLWVAVGGALGGLFNVLLAPLLFDSVIEYPLLVALAPTAAAGVSFPRSFWRGLRSPIIAVAALVGAWYLLVPFGDQAADAPRRVMVVAIAASCVAALACYRHRDQPLLLSFALTSIVVAGLVTDRLLPGVLLRERDFFGVRRVRFDREAGVRVLYNGTTKHGAQSTGPMRRREPLSYYAASGPLGDVFRAMPEGSRRRVGVVGLGAGGISAYARAGEDWTFYELDPAVVQIARNPKYFTYLSDSPAVTRIEIGDGRLSLGRAADGSLDILILDAFSSDAVPVHLLTKQALRLYRQKMSPGGVLVIHLSNRYLDLEPVVAHLARDASLSALIRNNTSFQASPGSQIDPSIWAILSAPGVEIQARLRAARWKSLRSTEAGVWTDDFSNVLESLRFLQRR
jgi:hypothetical protein